MEGYVGERARRRKRRFVYIIFFVIIFLTIIYFSYNVKDEKKGINNEITFTDATIDTEQSRIDKEELELKIIEKEQKIVFRDQLIKSFKKQITVDDDYMFKIQDSVINNTPIPITLYPYGRIVREKAPPILGFFILHEGFLGLFGDEDDVGIKEKDYDDIEDKKYTIKYTTKGENNYEKCCSKY